MIDKSKVETRKKGRELYEALMEKHEGDMAAVYAEVEATANKLVFAAETPEQKKDLMSYNFVKDLVEELIINSFMKNAGYTYGGEGVNALDFTWRKEGADNGNNSNNQ